MIDRLVDGELSDQQQRELLLSLEQEPAGWRRCALAFLEAQQWRAQLGEYAKAPPTVEPAPATRQCATRSSQSSWLARNPGTMFALAASVLVAFGLGLAANRFTADRFVPQPNNLAIGKDPAVPSPVQGVTLVVDGPNGRNSQVQVPVTENASPAPNWWLAGDQGLPSDIRRALERAGHQIRQQRELLPVQLDDGRRAVVPVDRVEIHPVGARSFQ
ncbi:MAG TPA: hypothetical protein VG713_20340 [Pirellulales bacterium]|nr:hypothetical protein [Pirellulales bacterium]